MVDLSAVTFLGSTGLSALLECAAARSLRLVGLDRAAVTRPLEITGLGAVLVTPEPDRRARRDRMSAPSTESPSQRAARIRTECEALRAELAEVRRRARLSLEQDGFRRARLRGSTSRRDPDS